MHWNSVLWAKVFYIAYGILSFTGGSRCYYEMLYCVRQKKYCLYLTLLQIPFNPKSFVWLKYFLAINDCVYCWCLMESCKRNIIFTSIASLYMIFSSKRLDSEETVLYQKYLNEYIADTLHLKYEKNEFRKEMASYMLQIFR